MDEVSNGPEGGLRCPRGVGAFKDGIEDGVLVSPVMRVLKVLTLLNSSFLLIYSFYAG